jgi:hypothetical protein
LSARAGSQTLPRGLPKLGVPAEGDFLGLIANSGSNAIADRLIGLAASYLPTFPVLALKNYFGIERAFLDLEHRTFNRTHILRP